MDNESPGIVGVRFRNAGKIQYFHASGIALQVGESVVVDTTRGPEVGRVVIAPDQVVVNELGDEDRRPILRIATDEDLERAADLEERATAILPEARRMANDTGLDGQIANAHFTVDGSRLTFSYTSEQRVDYRDFLRRAGDTFGARVDMQHIGARDRARLAGGYGICGRELCCSSWLTTFPSISIRLAKDQELPLNPEKISGLCGRLLCCLSYEEEGYKEMRRTLPKMGQRVSTPTGEGKVVGINVLRRLVTIRAGGDRIEVGDRDLGTVVRWDIKSKSGDPPPSMTRADAIAQGIVEADEIDLAPEIEPETAFPVAPAPRPASPRRERPARPAAEGERPASPAAEGDRSRRPRGRRGGGGGSARAPRPNPPGQPPHAPQPGTPEPERRVFRRRGDTSSTPPGTGALAPRPPRDPATPPPTPPAARRRRGRRRRGGGSGDNTAPSSD